MNGVGRAVVLMAALIAHGCSNAASSNGGYTPGPGFGGSIGSGSGGSNSGGGASTGSGSGGIGGLTVPAVWGVQVDPPSSSPYAVGQWVNRDVSTSASFQIAASSTVTVTVNGASGSVASAANVLLAVPPLIPGRPDLIYQAQSTASASGTSTSAALQVTPDALGASGTVSLVPLPPADQQVPSYAFAGTVYASMSLAVPTGDVVVSGQLNDAVQSTQSFAGVPYIARAFQNGALVSDAPLTQSDGSFQLRVLGAAAVSPVTLDLRSTAALPWAVSMPFTIVPGRSLGDILLPAFNPATAFSVTVVDGPAGIGGATVRAQAWIGTTAGTTAVSCTAQYTASGSTDSKGNVVLQLLAGAGKVPVSYQLLIVPLAGSPYATQCASVDALGGSPPQSTTPPPTLPAVTVTRRPVLTGTIHTADGAPLSNVTVTASGTPAVPGCPALDPITASTTADATGRFNLPLDPGAYQIDYDPPAGSSAPRLTELDVEIPATVPAVETVSHDVVLPAGALVKGSVRGPSGEPVASALVRFFEPRCTGQPDDCFGPNRTPPWLRGKALTDASGQFRMVVPIPAAP